MKTFSHTFTLDPFLPTEIMALRQTPGGHLFYATYTGGGVVGNGLLHEFPTGEAGIFLALSPSTRLIATRGGIYETRPPFAKKYPVSQKAAAAAWSVCGRRLLVATDDGNEFVDIPGREFDPREFNLPIDRAINLYHLNNFQWFVLSRDHNLKCQPSPAGSWPDILNVDHAAIVQNDEGRIRIVYSHFTNHALLAKSPQETVKLPNSSLNAVWNVEECPKRKHALIVVGLYAVVVVDYDGQTVAIAENDTAKVWTSACLSLNGRQLFMGTLKGQIFVYTLPEGAIEGEVVDSGVPLVVEAQFGVHNPESMIFRPEPEPAKLEPAKRKQRIRRELMQVSEPAPLSVSGRPIRSCRLKSSEVALKTIIK